jgi:hypothetical protein
MPETYYHGTNKGDIKEINMSPDWRTNDQSRGFWGSDNPRTSNTYADDFRRGTLYPFRVKKGQTESYNYEGNAWGNPPEGVIGAGANTNDIARKAFDRGVDAVEFRDIVDVATSVDGDQDLARKYLKDILRDRHGPDYQFNPMDATTEDYGKASTMARRELLGESNNVVVGNDSLIRSPNAAFDPQYTGPNIMGGAAGTAALAGLLAAPEEAEAKAKSEAASEFISGVMGLIDPRYDNRVGSRDRMAALTPGVESRGTLEGVPRISLSSLEGRDFITSMSDRTRGGGLLQAINDVELAYPVNLQGGQDFMMENPGMVWASAHTPVHQIMREAGGENMLYLPFRMAPTGGDFAKMTGEAMLSYASANMTPAVKKEFDKAVSEYVTKGKMVKDKKTGESKLKGAGLSIKGWKGVDDPSSVEAWRKTPDSVRKELMDMMDKRFRNKGGLAIGEARLAVSDPLQVGARDAGIQNVGEVFGGGDIIVKSGHPSYPYGVPGQGLGRLDDQPMSIFDLLPDARLGKEQRRVGDTVDPLNPSARDIRALQMKPYKGRIDEGTLRRLEDRGVNVNSPAALNAGLMQIYAEDAHNIELDNMMRSIGMESDPMYEYGTFRPQKQNIVTGEVSFAVPEFIRDTVRGLLDIGLTPRTGVYNPNALLDMAL